MAATPIAMLNYFNPVELTVIHVDKYGDRRGSVSSL